MKTETRGVSVGKEVRIIKCGATLRIIMADDALDGIADSDEGGVMIMCETCNVWQHVQCMGVHEDDLPEHYHCERCQPSLHVELLK
jgi:hypothetical protein